jgi:hypothetical protein
VGDELPRGSIATLYNNIREKNSQISLTESNAILRENGVVIARNRGHLNPEMSLTSMPLIIHFNARLFRF